MDSTPTQPINADSEESLSDVDVDLEELEHIPDDFIPPMLGEDGSPVPDSDSDTTYLNNTTNHTNENDNDVHRQSPSADAVRLLMIAVQGDDTGMRIEDTLFPAANSSIRHPLQTSPRQTGIGMNTEEEGWQ